MIKFSQTVNVFVKLLSFGLPILQSKLEKLKHVRAKSHSVFDFKCQFTLTMHMKLAADLWAVKKKAVDYYLRKHAFNSLVNIDYDINQPVLKTRAL